MRRRTAIKSIGSAMCGTAVSFSGCSGSSGSTSNNSGSSDSTNTSDSTSNDSGNSDSTNSSDSLDIERSIEYAAEQDEYVELSDITEEVTQTNGSEGVAVSGTAKNTSDLNAYIELVMTFVNSEGTTLGEISAFPKGSTTPNEPGEAAEFEATIAEAPSEIKKYTIEVRAT
jgi:hypothetical protein